jgi:cytidylate kinase
MNKIITIGRQFGSGGREFGKRLADELGCPYYDREIMTEIAQRTQLAEEYIQRIVEQRPGYHFPITVGRTLHGGASDYLMHQYASVYAEQSNAILDLAKKSDCVIVGCCADYILRDMKPTRIFIYADPQSRMERCRQKGSSDEHLSDAKLWKKIRSIDRNRAKYYRYYTGQAWGNRSNYDICLNTSHTNIKSAAHALAMMIRE